MLLHAFYFSVSSEQLVWEQIQKHNSSMCVQACVQWLTVYKLDNDDVVFVH